MALVFHDNTQQLRSLLGHISMVIPTISSRADPFAIELALHFSVILQLLFQVLAWLQKCIPPSYNPPNHAKDIRTTNDLVKFLRYLVLRYLSIVGYRPPLIVSFRPPFLHENGDAFHVEPEFLLPWAIGLRHHVSHNPLQRLPNELVEAADRGLENLKFLNVPEFKVQLMILRQIKFLLSRQVRGFSSTPVEGNRLNDETSVESSQPIPTSVVKVEHFTVLPIQEGRVVIDFKEFPISIFKDKCRDLLRVVIKVKIRSGKFEGKMASFQRYNGTNTCFQVDSKLEYVANSNLIQVAVPSKFWPLLE